MSVDESEFDDSLLNSLYEGSRVDTGFSLGLLQSPCLSLQLLA